MKLDLEALRRRARQAAEQLRQQLRARAGQAGGPSHALSAFVRPELGAVPPPLRRLLEPVVAALAITLLAGLGAVATVNIATLMLVAAVVVLILRLVFGIELDLVPPPFA
jgi:hypothetical protein